MQLVLQLIPYSNLEQDDFMEYIIPSNTVLHIVVYVWGGSVLLNKV